MSLSNQIRSTAFVGAFIAAAIVSAVPSSAQDRQVGSSVVAVQGDRVALLVPKTIDAHCTSVSEPDDGPNRARYWVGLNTAPVGEALRSHLKIAKGEGLLILDVVGKSPAARAGLQRHDILLKVGNAAVDSSDDLARIIQDSGAKQVDVQIIRQGKRLTIGVTPAERESAAIHEHLIEFRPSASGKLSAEMLAVLKRHGLARQRIFSARIVGPGLALPKPPETAMRIQVEDAPAGKWKITITRDGSSQSFSEDQLERLPEDIRPVIEQALKVRRDQKALSLDFQLNGRVFRTTDRDLTVKQWQGGPWGRFRWRVAPGVAFTPVGIQTIQIQQSEQEAQLREINRKLQLLHATVEQLRSQGGK